MNRIRQALTAIAVLVLLTSCAGGNRVTDFSDRSVAYGWLDIGDVDANRLHSVVMYQLRPQSKAPYYNVKLTKFEGGYLFYAFAFERGAIKLYEISGQRCVMILCGNSTFSYNFGKQGSQGAVSIEDPGVYFIGSLALEEVKTGWLEQGKFDIAMADDAPSQRTMLEAMLKDARSTDPLISARIEAELQRL